MNAVELFAGIGGFRLGLEANEINVIWANEWDKYAADTYDKNFKDGINRSDITTIATADIPDHDLLVGGFPCQAFSVAGNRRGFDETRGTLFFDVARILKDKKPEHFILENVKGLLSHDAGRTFQTILGVLADLGYGVEWQILNSKYFGVPQNRERVYIIGHLRTECTGQILPIRSDDAANLGSPEGEVSGTIDTGYAKNHRQSGATYVRDQIGTISHGKFRETDTSLTLDSNYYKGADNHGQRPMVKQIGQMYDNPYNSQAGRIYDKEGISPTLDVMGGGNRQPKVVVQLTEARTEEAKQIRRETKDKDFSPRRGKVLVPRPDDIANTIPTAQTREQLLLERINNERIRRLTPTECERLQGFPDNWTEGVSDTQRYKQCGNAVTVNVVREVAKRLAIPHTID